MTDEVTTPPPGASGWERDLYQHLAGHVRQEGALLDEYVRAADQTRSKALAFLIDLLATDERRHHQLFADLLSSLRSDIELRRTEPDIPRLDFDRADTAQVSEVTSRLLERERSDRAELRRLRKELKGVEDTTLWVLLVDVMLHDTAKHIAVLEFVERHTTRHRR